MDVSDGFPKKSLDSGVCGWVGCQIYPVFLGDFGNF